MVMVAVGGGNVGGGDGGECVSGGGSKVGWAWFESRGWFARLSSASKASRRDTAGPELT
jgi:hypothetical protein